MVHTTYKCWWAQRGLFRINQQISYKNNSAHVAKSSDSFYVQRKKIEMILATLGCSKSNEMKITCSSVENGIP